MTTNKSMVIDLAPRVRFKDGIYCLAQPWYLLLNPSALYLFSFCPCTSTYSVTTTRNAKFNPSVKIYTWKYMRIEHAQTQWLKL